MGKKLVTPSTESSDILKIRAHHLLCIQGFQGYGYSRDFERNMERIVNFLTSNPNSPLELMVGADIICQKCPHLENGHCNRSSSSTIRDMDLKVLKKLGLKEGAREPAQKLLGEVKAWDRHDLQGICWECSWKDKCLLYLSKSEED